MIWYDFRPLGLAHLRKLGSFIIDFKKKNTKTYIENVPLWRSDSWIRSCIAVIQSKIFIDLLKISHIG